MEPDIVGTTCISAMYPEALAVLQAAKSINPQITTILGGPHATLHADETIKYEAIDFIFRGETINKILFPRLK